ncbi:glycosyltransferase family 2 protein [Microbacterium sp. EYE_5]|uniref:glycosyltransferase family 2 protein n=1 Tax=unclassified Microbacterium TaxID=2609290 RepID=UPI002002A4EC|nr:MULTISPECIES: glycosyltransferase family 2 protein [unclassified Microbacterium]MCK6079108.1 glycosyltransferase family 2 protein [Microbacterium sp. EYE_382]MCK6084378.1 glycosyltransferase family 2 protein [Microbacterium sp. EYE_384]MCK6123393.1 glycosyltransferase family 2 protein [Microbacterium sp. EYE_80]MCK6125142.1 glycosyltransferase family 2 protein [Microbacterium sp. EYE_79]MCK6140062.1 glycosyltransferase family 2 protein [Microbacterium sp. EYE_39]
MLAVVLNWNGIDDTISCLEHLFAQDYPSLDIVVVDNASTDDSIRRLTALEDSSQITFLRNSENLGFSGGVNVGIAYALDAGYDAVALINNDALPEREWVSQLVHRMVVTGSSVATGLLLSGDGETIDSTGDFFSWWGMPYPRNRGDRTAAAPESGPVFGASGGGTLYRTTFFRDVGVFDERFFAYFEDVDLSFRGQLKGHTFQYVKEARAYHARGASSAKVPGFTTRQTFRNLPTLFWRNLPLTVATRAIPRAILLYVMILANAVRTGRGRDAVVGAGQGLALLVQHGLKSRRTIQRTRRVSASVVARMLTHQRPWGAA